MQKLTWRLGGRHYDSHLCCQCHSSLGISQVQDTDLRLPRYRKRTSIAHVLANLTRCWLTLTILFKLWTMGTGIYSIDDAVIKPRFLGQTHPPVCSDGNFLYRKAVVFQTMLNFWPICIQLIEEPVLGHEMMNNFQQFDLHGNYLF